jgi:hypothetical protein
MLPCSTSDGAAHAVNLLPLHAACHLLLATCLPPVAESCGSLKYLSCKANTLYVVPPRKGYSNRTTALVQESASSEMLLIKSNARKA